MFSVRFHTIYAKLLSKNLLFQLPFVTITMNSDRETLCDWLGCEALATRHLRFGFAAAGDKPYVATHGNYCDHHMKTIINKFQVVSTFELGECPDGCDEIPTPQE